MKIVLLKDVAKIGKAGDVKEVSDGYAKNFLIARGFAAVATNKLLSQLEAKKKEIENKKEAELLKTKELAGKLNNLEIKVPLKIGEDGKSFGSVTIAKIISAVKKAGFDIEKSQVDLEENIKTLGTHDVRLNLGHGVIATIKVVSEAEK